MSLCSLPFVDEPASLHRACVLPLGTALHLGQRTAVTEEGKSTRVNQGKDALLISFRIASN